MISNRPYLIRALHAWISDNGLTPYILVNATVPGCRIPENYINDGRMILNIAGDVVERLELGNDAIAFTARFSGVPTFICVPVAAVTAIYAKENGEGMAFPDDMQADSGGEGKTSGPPRAKGKPNLKIVK